MESPPASTELPVPRPDRVVLFGIFPIIGAAAGALLPIAARWALSWDIALPFGFAFRFVGAIDVFWEIATGMTAVALLALAVGVIGWGELVRLTVAEDHLDVTRDGRTRTLRRSDISAIFDDGGQCVVLDRQAREVIREKPAARMSDVAAAFQRYGYPWRDDHR